MSNRKLTPFNDLLRQVEEEFAKAFPVPKQEQKKQMKKIEWEHEWSDGKKSLVRILIDPETETIMDVVGLRENGTIYPLPVQAVEDVSESVKQHDNWKDFWTDV